MNNPIKVGDIELYIIVGYNNYTERKIRRYELGIMKCMDIEQKEVINKDTKLPVIINLPTMQTILRTKITKRQAIELQEHGVKISGGYSLQRF